MTHETTTEGAVAVKSTGAVPVIAVRRPISTQGRGCPPFPYSQHRRRAKHKTDTFFQAERGVAHLNTTSHGHEVNGVPVPRIMGKKPLIEITAEYDAETDTGGWVFQVFEEA